VSWSLREWEKSWQKMPREWRGEGCEVARDFEERLGRSMRHGEKPK